MRPPFIGVRVLQLQTDTGVTGGISAYIGELVRSPAMIEYSFVVTAANLVANAQPIRELYGPRLSMAEMPKSYSLWSLPSYVMRLRALFRSHQIDIVHAHAVRSALAAAIAALIDGIPLVYTNHGLRYTQKRSLAGKILFKMIEWFVCRVAKKVCAIRRFDYDVLVNSRGCRSKLCLIETRIRAPLSLSAPDCLNDSVRLMRSPWILVGIGSLIEVKRPDRFLEWIRALRHSHLDISATWIGDGPLRLALEERARALNLPVTFLGHQPRDQVFRILATAHLLLLTSEFEVFPFAVLEAYSQGVPVISNCFTGAEEFVGDGRTGLLVNADSPDDVAHRVADLLRDKGLLEGMGRAARTEFASRFGNPDVMALAYSGIYAKLAGSTCSDA